MSMPLETDQVQVSLPIRLTEDGSPFIEATVVSITGQRLRARGSGFPGAGRSVFFLLGDGDRTVRGDGTVSLATPTAAGASEIEIVVDRWHLDLVELVAQLAPSYPGALPIEPDGCLAWPITADEDPIEPSSPPDELPCPPGGYLEHLVASHGADADHLVIHYRGRPLAPTKGVPRHALDVVRSLLAVASPEPGTDSIGAESGDTLDALWEQPYAELLWTQIRAIDALTAGGWRLGLRLALRQADLERFRVSIESLGLRVAATPDGELLGADLPAEFVASSGQAIESLVAWLGSVVWHARAVPPRRDAGEAYTEWQIDRSARVREKTAARSEGPQGETAASSSAAPGTARVAPPKRRKGPSWWEQSSDDRRKLAMVLGVIAGISLVGRIMVAIVVGPTGPLEREPPKNLSPFDLRHELLAVVPTLPVEDLEIKGFAAKAVVSAEWLTRAAGERRSDLERASFALSLHQLSSLLVVTADGTERGAFRNGQFEVY